MLKCWKRLVSQESSLRPQYMNHYDFKLKQLESTMTIRMGTMYARFSRDSDRNPQAGLVSFFLIQIPPTFAFARFGIHLKFLNSAIVIGQRTRKLVSAIIVGNEKEIRTFRGR
jgi:hypothetical protein